MLKYNTEDLLQDNVRIEGQILEQKTTDDKIRYILKDAVLVSSLPISHKDTQLQNVAVYMDAANVYPSGTRLRCGGKLSEIEPPGNPGQFDSRTYYACQHVYFRMYANYGEVMEEGGGLRETMRIWKEHFTEELSLLLDEDCTGILCAMLLGDKDLLTEESRYDFQISGMMHMLCISGMHIMLLGMGLFYLLLHLHIPQPLAAVLSVFLMCIYGIFVGSSVSVLRAILMFAIRLLARVIHRTYDHYTALALAAILLLLENPHYCLYSGFQLSFAAVLGIAMVLPVLEKMEKEWLDERMYNGTKSKTRPKKSLRQKVLMRMQQGSLAWLAVTATSLPIMLRNYYEFPIWSPLINLILVPGAAFFMISGIGGVLLGFYSIPLGRMLLFPASTFLHLFDLLMKGVRFLPFRTWITGQPALWQVILWYMGLAIFLFWIPRKQNRKRDYACGILLFFCLISLFIRLPAPFSITALDVGQGDCIVMQTQKKAVYIVDGGSSSVEHTGKYRILPYLKQQGISHVEAVFLSHPDLDHYNGLTEWMEMMRDRKTSVTFDRLPLPIWIQPKETEDGRDETDEIQKLAMQAGVKIVYVSAGDTINSYDTTLRVLHPLKDSKNNEGNAGSIVLEVLYDGFSALLTGDVEGEGETELLNAMHPYDYLKAAHHGSHNSSSEEFLEKVRPKICIFSAPRHSRYGHPHKETISRMEAVGSKWWQTGVSGAVRVEVHKGKVEVKPFQKNPEN